MIRRSVLIIALSTITALIGTAQPSLGGYIAGDLAQRVIDEPSATYTVYVCMEDEDGTDVSHLSRSLHSYTRQARHSRLINALRARSESSQSEIKRFLSDRQGAGDVVKFKGYWIDNVVVATAKGHLIYELSYRSDVDVIFEASSGLLIEPVRSQSAAAPMDTLPSALKVIGADSMWALGYTGEGTLVGSLDTGIDGDHPALSDSWRGNNGYSAAESWFDPVDGEDYPHTFPGTSNPEHGTHVLGIMVAHDDATGDTVGVAPDAQWISAAVIDIPGALILDGLEWAADPDGNPNTITDVPDVLCNSWGYRNADVGCEDVFWRAIDNLEELGVFVVFACGNEGEFGPQTIRNPANRATSPYSSFAVGMIDPTDPLLSVYNESSRGPSDCDGVSLKPQVTAPGARIRSTVPVANGSYGVKWGTSMAAPHVAGAAALLRQYNPNAHVDSIKQALMATAIDIESAGPDYASGYGLIYIPAALEVLAPNNEPNVFILDIENDSPNPGDTIEITVTLKNSGLGVISVKGTIRAEYPSVTIVDSTYDFGDIPLEGTVNNIGSPFTIAFAEDIISGTEINLTLHLESSGDYETVIPLDFTVGSAPLKSEYAHDAGSASFGISNYGEYGFADGSAVELGLPGFVWPEGGQNHLYEMGLAVGVDSVHVSDGARNPIWRSDDDFAVVPGGDLEISEPGEQADEETYSIFDDSNAEDPIGIRISQRTLAYAAHPNDDYIFLIYRLFNDSDSTLNGVRIGFISDWDWPWGGAGSDKVGFYADANLGYMFSALTDDPRGIAVLNSEGATSFSAIDNFSYIIQGYGRTDAQKWGFLSSGIQDPPTIPKDQSFAISTGPFDIAPGDSAEAAFAVIGAASTLDLFESAELAALKYRAIRLAGISIEIDSVYTDQKEEAPEPFIKPDGAAEIPLTYSLDQNYPNPFNPTTTISFSIEKPSHTRLTIYNILGQKVTTLIDRNLPAGEHSVRWDASGLASGLYLYRLQSGDFIEVRKMVLTR